MEPWRRIPHPQVEGCGAAPPRPRRPRRRQPHMRPPAAPMPKEGGSPVSADQQPRPAPSWGAVTAARRTPLLVRRIRPSAGDRAPRAVGSAAGRAKSLQTKHPHASRQSIHAAGRVSSKDTRWLTPVGCLPLIRLLRGWNNTQLTDQPRYHTRRGVMGRISLILGVPVLRRPHSVESATRPGSPGCGGAASGHTQCDGAARSPVSTGFIAVDGGRGPRDTVDGRRGDGSGRLSVFAFR